MVRGAASVAVGALIAISSAASAQRRDSAPVRPPARGAKAAKTSGTARGLPQKAAPGDQQALARQVRQRFAQVIRKQLNLSDGQFRQVQGVEAKFQQQRNQLQRDERQSRLGLRAAMQDTGTAPDQAKISQYMAQLVQAQHRRADLLETEQEELGAFLTPLQRAKYQALHDQLNRRVQDLKKNPGSADLPPVR